MHSKHWLILAVALLPVACGPDEPQGASGPPGNGKGAQQGAEPLPASEPAAGAGNGMAAGAAAGAAGEPAAGDAAQSSQGAAARAEGPYPCIPGDATAGGVHYQTLCASCHGQDGGGDGPAAAALVPKPASHRDGAYMNALSNAHLVRVISQGGAAAGKSPLMAPFGAVLGETGVQDVTAFVRTLAAPPYACP